MKYSRIIFYTLLLSFIWISCDKDEIAPEISITSPDQNSTFFENDVLTVAFIVTDNVELELANISISNGSGEALNRSISLSDTSQTVSEDFDLAFQQSSTLEIKIEALDKAGNSKTVSRNVEFQYFDAGTIDFNFKLEYNGSPLVLFEDYTYPDGKKIDFTRVSFYTSDLKLDETVINEVEFHNLSNSHSSSTLAAAGYDWEVANVPTGSYSNLSFNIGVSEPFNNMDPGEFPSGHPLAKPSENWFSWMSYIFLKIEGNVDLDGDGVAETGIAIHTGANEALRNLSFASGITVTKNETTEVNLIFDVYDLFDGPSRIFPIEEYPQIHSLTQLDGVLEISDNLINSFHKS